MVLEGIGVALEVREEVGEVRHVLEDVPTAATD